MELKIKEVQLPEKIEFNFEELKQELAEKAHDYETMVYTEDQIKEAKADRAKLNNLKKALNDERIRREKEYMAPFNVFKNQINEVIGIIDKPIGIIDQQVKEYDAKRKAEKEDKIRELFDAKEKPEWLTLEQIFDSKWLNATTTEKKIEGEMNIQLEVIAKNVGILKELQFGFEALECYKKNLDMGAAVAEGQRLLDIQKRKEEAERIRKEQEEAAKQAELAKAQEPEPEPEPQQAPEEPQTQEEPEKVSCETPEPEEQTPAEPQRYWLGFKAYLTREEAKALGTFLKENNILVKKLEV